MWGIGWSDGIPYTQLHWNLDVKVEHVWNVMAHAQKPDLVFQRNGRVHLNRRGGQFSRLLAAEVCASAVVMVVMLDAPCSEAECKTAGYPLHSPVSPLLPHPCVTVCHQVSTELYHWFMCRMLFSVLSLKITLQSCLEQTCTKLQQTCCLSTADGNLPIMWKCWKPTWAIRKCEVCTNGMCFVSYPPVHIIFVICWKWDLILSYSVLLSCILVFLCTKWLHS